MRNPWILSALLASLAAGPTAWAQGNAATPSDARNTSGRNAASQDGGAGATSSSSSASSSGDARGARSAPADRSRKAVPQSPRNEDSVRPGSSDVEGSSATGGPPADASRPRSSGSATGAPKGARSE